MKLKLLAVLSLLAAFVLGFGSAILYQGSARDLAGEVSLDAARSSPAQLFAQGDYGYRCATANGICPLDVPQLIGSACTCPGDGAEGTTVR
jgi:hypothetical protein